MRIVLDTNIVMDMLHFRDVRTAWLKNAIGSGRVRCFGDSECLEEFERVTAYPEFALTPTHRCELIAEYLAIVTRCEATIGENEVPLPRCRDADDQKFLALAARCGADLLVTRDKQLLRLARHRNTPPPFAILTAEAAGGLFEPAAENPPAVV